MSQDQVFQTSEGDQRDSHQESVIAELATKAEKASDDAANAVKKADSTLKQFDRMQNIVMLGFVVVVIMLGAIIISVVIYELQLQQQNNQLLERIEEKVNP